MRKIGYVTVILVCVAGAIADDCDPLGGSEGACPIVINFANDTYRLSGEDAPVTFDFFGTGQPVQIGWTAAETDQAFLCLDRNQSGTIDHGGELFGNVTVLEDGRRARNGFDALAEFDHNADAVINDQDAIWPELLLWRDLNHDAVSQPQELTRVQDSDLRAIGLTYHFSGRLDSSGNAFRYQSTVWIGGQGRPVVPRPVYDVFFIPLT